MMPSNRRVIQVAVSESETETSGNRTIVVLCDDGSIWEIVSPFHQADRPQWQRLPPVPGTE